METATSTRIALLPLLVMAGLIIGFMLFNAARSRRIGSAVYVILGALIFCPVALVAIYSMRSIPHPMARMFPSPRVEVSEVPPAPQPPAPLDTNDLGNLPADGARFQAEAPLADGGHTPLPSERIDDQKTRPSTDARGPRPAWVDAPTGRVGKPYRTHVSWVDAPTGSVGQVYRTRVAVGDYATREECERNVPDALRQAVGRYVELLIGAGAGKRIMARLPLPYIHEHIVKEEWEEHPNASFGEMVRLHELLEFDQRTNTYLRDLHEQALVTERLKYTTVATGGVFGLLATIFGYLKLDTLTRGYYTGRLRMGTVAAVAAIIAGLLAMA